MILYLSVENAHLGLKDMNILLESFDKIMFKVWTSNMFKHDQCIKHEE